MQVEGLHGVKKPLLLSPSQQALISKKLGPVDKDPAAALSRAVRDERRRVFAVVAAATERHWRKERSRLVEVTFRRSDLGLRLALVGGGRERVEVAETREECEHFPDTVRPTDELVAVNGRLVIEPSRESFPCLVAEISARRPLTLTFSKGLARRDKAFAQQQLTRSHRLPDDGRRLRREKAIIEARAAAEREIKDDIECDCFRKHLLRGACHASVVVAPVLAPGPCRETSTIRRGDFVRVRRGVVPRLGWGDVTHSSVGLVTRVERDKYAFVACTVCFNKKITAWLCDAADLEAIFEEITDSTPDEVPGEVELLRKERAYIFEAHPEQAQIDAARCFVQEDVAFLVEDERHSRPRHLVGSTHAAHAALVKGHHDLLRRWQAPDAHDFTDIFTTRRTETTQSLDVFELISPEEGDLPDDDDDDDDDDDGDASELCELNTMSTFGT